MAYRYRCGVCRTTSDGVESRRAAESERGRHREAVHGGHVPDGESITGADDAAHVSLAHVGLFFAVLAVVVAVGWVRDFLG